MKSKGSTTFLRFLDALLLVTNWRELDLMSNQMDRRKFIVYTSAALGVGTLIKACTPFNKIPAPSPSAGANIKVGILHSLSGTMAISEQSLVDATQLAIRISMTLVDF
jgi:hypothetical protein